MRVLGLVVGLVVGLGLDALRHMRVSMATMRASMRIRERFGVRSREGRRGAITPRSIEPEPEPAHEPEYGHDHGHVFEDGP